MEHKLEHSAGYQARGLMRRLLETVHQQWLYRNATVHVKLKDGMTASQHEAILVRIEECLSNTKKTLHANKKLHFTGIGEMCMSGLCMHAQICACDMHISILPY